MTEAAITPAARSRNLSIDKSPAFDRGKRSQRFNRKTARVVGRTGNGAESVRGRPAPPDCHDERLRAASRINGATFHPAIRDSPARRVQFNGRHTTHLPARGHMPCLRRLRLRPLRRPPRAGSFAGQRPRRSPGSPAALPSPVRFQSTAKDHCRVTTSLLRESRKRKPRSPGTPA